MAIRVNAPAFRDLVDEGAELEKLGDGCTFTEGPLWNSDGNFLLFSDMPGDVRRRWDEGQTGFTEVANPSNKGNGMTFDLEGRLVVCEHVTSSLVRMDPDGTGGNRETLASHYEGKELNSPNDVIVANDGSIYFSDPPAALVNRTGPDRELDYAGVFRLAPDNSLHLIDTMSAPNGIGVSPDGTKLYHSDGPTGWVMWDLDKQGNASNRRNFVARSVVMGGDSLKIDAAGNMWAASREGVTVFTPGGERIGFISTDQGVSNCELGADGYLYLASSTRVLRVRAKAKKLLFKVT